VSEGVQEEKKATVSLLKRSRKRYQEGFTIIELLIGITVVALILAGAAALIKQLFAGSNITRETCVGALCAER
jgi:prepilin-type N-terminal cleavage/methylation domain-containing protein